MAAMCTIGRQRSRHDGSARYTTMCPRDMGSGSQYNFCIVKGGRPLCHDTVQERYDTEACVRNTVLRHGQARCNKALRHGTVSTTQHTTLRATQRAAQSATLSATWPRQGAQCAMTRRLVRHDRAPSAPRHDPQCATTWRLARGVRAAWAVLTKCTV